MELADDTLNVNQRRFCVEYATLRNGTRAYLNAYPEASYDTASMAACALLVKPKIRAVVLAIERENARRTKITARKVLRELANVAFNDVAGAFEEDPENGGLPSPKPLGQIDPATRRTIQSVKVKRRKVLTTDSGEKTVQTFVEEIEYKFADKLGALDKLCKHLGLTNDGSALEQLLAFLRDGPAGNSRGLAPGSAGGSREAIEAGEPDHDPDDGTGA